jgi:hypothetical protein
MTKNQTIKPQRGGKREGAGRAPDFRKRCEIHAIQLALAISESHARRTFREWRGNMASIMGSHQYAKVLAEWDEMSAFEKGMVYGILKTRVEHMLERGFGRR